MDAPRRLENATMTHDLIAKHDKEEGKLLLKFFTSKKYETFSSDGKREGGEKKKGKNLGEREWKNEISLVLRERNWTESKKVIKNYVRIPTI